jgi:uncharacterized protein YecE (DUF72 family)
MELGCSKPFRSQIATFQITINTVLNEIREQTKILRVYFNNHYGGKAVVNAMQFKEMIGISLSADESKVLENTKTLILGN